VRGRRVWESVRGGWWGWEGELWVGGGAEVGGEGVLRFYIPQWWKRSTIPQWSLPTLVLMQRNDHLISSATDIRDAQEVSHTWCTVQALPGCPNDYTGPVSTILCALHQAKWEQGSTCVWPRVVYPAAPVLWHDGDYQVRIMWLCKCVRYLLELGCVDVSYDVIETIKFWLSYCSEWSSASSLITGFVVLATPFVTHSVSLWSGTGCSYQDWRWWMWPTARWPPDASARRCLETMTGRLERPRCSSRCVHVWESWTVDEATLCGPRHLHYLSCLTGC